MINHHLNDHHDRNLEDQLIPCLKYAYVAASHTPHVPRLRRCLTRDRQDLFLLSTGHNNLAFTVNAHTPAT
jgi:hypothetical protein